MAEVNNVSKAIIPVAGLGTRMLPASKAIPKELLPILNKPIIQYVVEEAINAGINQIIFITNDNKVAIEKHFDTNFFLESSLKKTKKKKLLESVKDIIPKNIKITSIKQKKPLGLGDAIYKANELISNEPFAVLLPDEFLLNKSPLSDLKNMINNYNLSKEGQVLVEKISSKFSKNYGVVDLLKSRKHNQKFKKIINFKEKPKSLKSKEAYRIIGRYILPSETMSFLKKAIPSKDGEIQLTDSLLSMINSEVNLNATLSSSKVYDCGSFKGLIGANIALASKDPKMKKYMKEILN